MASSTKPSSRYSSFDARSSNSSQISGSSSSTEFKNPSKNHHSSLKRIIGNSKATRRVPSDTVSAAENSSRALVKAKGGDLAVVKGRNEQNFSAMVKKFMERRASNKKAEAKQTTALVIPADFIAEDLKKTASKGSSSSNISNLHRKFFRKGSGSGGSEVKALTEVKSNTRTLAMVLRSERELLSQNKEHEMEITKLKLMIEEKNREVEKLKDLCLNQREEIKSLKSAILFPDVMNSQLHYLLEKQGSELKQAKQVIPTLQQQVTSLTGQLQCLADDLAEVKADKYSVRSCFDSFGSPKTPILDQGVAFSSEYSSGDEMRMSGTPDDMFLKDLNPCLTPYSKSKSKEFDETTGYDSSSERGLFWHNEQVFDDSPLDPHPRGQKMSRSSESYIRPNPVIITAPVTRRSDGNKCTNGMPMHRMVF
ncbi:hypothetical protein Syun_009583 [Stephania yunnanensis]|uniref:Uncharacterized protein n=1 Tax=Stephania yunnanensis TaxID=152371 RepID=A0AAP0KGY2_9MAGN